MFLKKLIFGGVNDPRGIPESECQALTRHSPTHVIVFYHIILNQSSVSVSYIYICICVYVQYKK